MRQLETTEVEVDGQQFYIRPFPALKAAGISGELARTLAPLMSILVPIVEALDDTDDNGNPMKDENGNIIHKSILDMDAKKVGFALASNLSSLQGIDGETVERTIKMLLLTHQNVIVTTEDDYGEKKPQTMTEDILNEVFAGRVQNIFVLCFYVVKVNFQGFFGKETNQFGDQEMPMIRPIK